MKHRWFITFLAVIALAGCSSEDSLKETQPLPTTSSTAIAFNSRSTGYANTRAAVGNLDSHGILSLRCKLPPLPENDDGYEYTTKRITLNKVVLLGDDTSGEGSSPKGVFYPAGYLNLGITTDESRYGFRTRVGTRLR